MSRSLKAQEIIGAVKRTDKLTLVVEGKTDSRIVREMADFVGEAGLVLKCDGRPAVLEVFNEVSRLGLRHCIVMADSDLYIFSGHPPGLSDIIFTEGYSIENDIIMSVNIEKLLKSHELSTYKTAVSAFMVWYIDRIKSNLQPSPPAGCSYSDSICSVIKIVGQSVSSLHGIKGSSSPCPVEKLIRSNPERYIRGKQLIEIIHKILQDPKYEVQYGVVIKH